MGRLTALAVAALLAVAVRAYGPFAGETDPTDEPLAAAAATANDIELPPHGQTAHARAASVRAKVDAAFHRVQHGLASYYADTFHGRLTASGVPFDNTRLVAAHPTYPFGTRLRVTNLATGQSVEVRVVDRGPAEGPQADGVVIDLSRAAAEVLDFVDEGRAEVRLERLVSATRAIYRRTAAAADR